jgi:glycosyltransferase involved in cell wall biosynthesis
MPGKTPVIVFINHWAKNIGGAERSLLDILEYGASRCRACVIASEQGPLLEKAAAFGVTCRVVPCLLKPGGKERENLMGFVLKSWKECVSFLRYVLAISAIIKTMEPECIHANVPKSHITLFLLVLLGYKGACLFHMREIFERFTLPYISYMILFPRKSGRVIAISNSVRTGLPRALRKKTSVIYNGVYVPDAVPAARSENKGLIRFLYVGRVVPWKGCRQLIEMFAEVTGRFPGGRATLTLIGDTLYWSLDYREALKTLIRDKGLTENCTLLPHVENPNDVFPLYDVFCSASYKEPFGRALAEAQAAAMPVVAFDSGGIKEIVEHGQTGLLAPYGGKDAFVQAMESFIKKPERIREMGAKGHERVRKLFNRTVQAPLIWKEILKQISSRTKRDDRVREC